jgi:hypothetical protein
LSHLPPPPESASIDAGLRTRLEGQVEVLEDSIALFDSVVSALNREELTRDDLDTLREAAIQVPRIEHAIAHVGSHAGAEALIALVRLRRQWAVDAVSLKSTTQLTSLADGLRHVLHRLEREGLSPTFEETVLESGAEASNTVPAVASVLGTVALGLALHSPLALVAAPVGWVLARKFAPQRRRWVLLPDRLFFAAQPGHEARSVALQKLRVLELTRTGVEVEFFGQKETLFSDDPAQLMTALRLVASSWLSGLESRPLPHLVLPGTESPGGERGMVLMSAEGLFFLRADRVELARAALATQPCATPTIERLMALIAHLPSGRWGGVAQQLAERADARWFAKGEVRFEPGANEHLGFSASAMGREVIVKALFPTPRSGEQTQVIAEGLMERLRG